MQHFEENGYFIGNPNFTSPGQETQEQILDFKATVLEFKRNSACTFLNRP